jgi:histidinol-phosphate aminotransferase
MTYEYEKVITPREGLRLHLNENTSGCSPAVLAALRQLSCEDAAYYPDYTEAISAAADYIGVKPADVLLTNGLDEGILATSIAALRGSSPADPFEAIVIVPAFDMYAACADVAGGRIVRVAQGPDFEFPTQAVLDAITSRTRLIFITDPNNPTGLTVPRQSILAIAAAAPAATVLVDEAYVDFRGDSLVGAPGLASCPNVVVGRTFAKAQGLAAMRIGALTGPQALLAPIRRVVLPYSVNVAAAVALPVALRDRAHIDAYLAQVLESKKRLYRALAEAGVQHWRSDANFVLARFGDAAPRVLARLLAAGIYVRDRSKEPGCAGCLRITTGVVAHTERAIAVIEEALCDAR